MIFVSVFNHLPGYNFFHSRFHRFFLEVQLVCYLPLFEAQNLHRTGNIPSAETIMSEVLVTRPQRVKVLMGM